MNTDTGAGTTGQTQSIDYRAIYEAATAEVVEDGHHAAIDEAEETPAAEAKEERKRAATKKALRRF